MRGELTVDLNRTPVFRPPLFVCFRQLRLLIVGDGQSRTIATRPNRHPPVGAEVKIVAAWKMPQAPPNMLKLLRIGPKRRYHWTDIKISHLKNLLSANIEGASRHVQMIGTAVGSLTMFAPSKHEPRSVRAVPVHLDGMSRRSGVVISEAQRAKRRPLGDKQRRTPKRLWAPPQ
jgi:hypothetical protein